MEKPQIVDLKNGSDQAMEAMWNSKHRCLVNYAEQLFRRSNRGTSDGEGAVQSAMLSFWKGIHGQRFEFGDDQGLMAILLTLVRRKVNRQNRAGYRQKRGGGSKHLSIDVGAGDDARQLTGPHHTNPAVLAEANEEVERLLSLLDDADLQQIAILKMEGRTDAEIANVVGRSRVTIVRKLGLIRQIWKTEAIEQCVS